MILDAIDQHFDALMYVFYDYWASPDVKVVYFSLNLARHAMRMSACRVDGYSDGFLMNITYEDLRCDSEVIDDLINEPR